jgi:carbon monoxide dehydrogenase subunit G
MQLQDERLIPATLHQTWGALNDPDMLKTCITGCESLERTGPDAYTAVVAVKVGPVSARFKGNLQMSNVQPPNSYTISFDGHGGIAGFGKGSADVKLLAAGDSTQLSYAVRAQVGGKMAQIGARLIDAAAGKIAEDFFKAFEVHLRDSNSKPDRVVPSEPVAVPAATDSNKTLWWVLATGAAIAIVSWLMR